MSKGGAPLRVVPRRSEDRGGADHGWLKTKHTFSFASYYDHRFSAFGPLRVLNEDRVQRGKGFPPHGHSGYEIMSYVVRGALRHADSVSRTDEVIPRGGVQFTSAGTGIVHSEYNASDRDEVHFLQIWVKPLRPRTAPAYHRRDFRDSDKRNRLLLMVEGDREPAAPADSDSGGDDDEAEGERDVSPIPIGADVRVYASILEPGREVSLPVEAGRQCYVHLVDIQNGARLAVSEGGPADLEQDLDQDDPQAAQNVLLPGDGVFVTRVIGGNAVFFTSVGKGRAEFLLFEMSEMAARGV